MFKKAIALLMPVLLVLPFMQIFHGSADALDKKVGMWYSTLYSNEGNYLWQKGHAVDSNDRFIGDVNGDGKDDVVFFYDSGGTWHTLLSNGNGFTYGAATTGHGQGSSKHFLADFDGDGCADAVAYWQSTGDWRVWRSNCNNAFIPDNTIRIHGHGIGSIDQQMGDINGDNKADAIIITPQGDWHGTTSTGTSFNYSGRWKVGHGAGTSFKHFVKDVTGDNLDDAVVFDPANGNWYVSPNTGQIGQSETNNSTWIVGHGYGSNNELLARADNNTSYDALVYFDVNNNGRWHISESTGSSFGGNPSIAKIAQHGNTGRLQAYKKGASGWQGIGDLDGDGIDEIVTFHNRGTDGQPLGEWRVLTLRENDTDYALPGYNNPKYSSPDQLNYWQANQIDYYPIVNSQPVQYDSGDTNVIDSHLAKMDDADIDYLLFDMTNGVWMPWVRDRAHTVCERIANYNSIHGTSLKFAIAQGDVQYKENDPNYPDMGVGLVESEAAQVMNYFVNDPTCGPHYFNWQGKPFLATHFASIPQIRTWESYYDHSQSDNFTMRYVLSPVPWDKSSSTYQSSLGNGCGPIPTVEPYPPEWGMYTGWGMPWGSLSNSSLMMVMPGWYVPYSSNISENQRVSRTQIGQEGRFYTECGWDRVQVAQPDMVVINSFNEFAEQTGVEPSNTSQLNVYTSPWSSSDFYWNLTKSNIITYKN